MMLWEEKNPSRKDGEDSVELAEIAFSAEEKDRRPQFRALGERMR